ncbi:MAG TPA: response regulator [Opitutaceae bacterium]|nr:response regulator [Opitutaceae bacterium]
MISTLRFLIVDDNADSRFLLVKTLLRKFPGAVVQECQDADAAVQIAASEKPAAIITHRAGDIDGLTLIRLVRRVNPTVPIVMVSGLDRKTDALAAGATRFLNYDEWLRIGSLVAELISRPTANPEDAGEPALN